MTKKRYKSAVKVELTDEVVWDMVKAHLIEKYDGVNAYTRKCGLNRSTPGKWKNKPTSIPDDLLTAVGLKNNKPKRFISYL